MNLLAGVNPVTRILAVILIATPLLLSIDPVSATVVLAFTLLMAPLCGMSWWRLLRRSWWLIVAAAVAAVSMVLYGQPGGEVHFSWWLITVTDNSIWLAAAIFLRVLAVALPVIVLSADVDPTDLGDGLSQVLRLPPRFVIGSVAALRLVGLLREDVESMRRARRARGLSDRTGPRYWVGLAFGVLVSSLRRGAKLATAMEARGFGREGQRTWARRSVLHARDWLVMSVALIVGVGSLGMAVWAGTFRFLGLG